eukprot:2549101-Alexandrium_andersonii.AAC.1
MGEQMTDCWQTFLQITAVNPEGNGEEHVQDLAASQPMDIEHEHRLRSAPCGLGLQGWADSEHNWIDEGNE